MSFPTINYHSCSTCPRDCHAKRTSIEFSSAYCKTTSSLEIASICKHMGEEPVLGGEQGVCNVFFTHCNLQCIYCQNYQISNNDTPSKNALKTIDEAVFEIIKILDSGISFLGFVSPTHQIKQMIEIIETLHQKGYFPTILYNTNGYEKVNTLKSIEKYIDIYLPDFKYADNDLAIEYSDAPYYKEIATNAIREMIRQKDIMPVFDKNGLMRKGVIVRHLILPSHTENSTQSLRHLKHHFGQELYISVMSQYFPPKPIQNHPILNRMISQKEYDIVINTVYDLGFTNGWIQDIENKTLYNPDFTKKNPFLHD